MRDILHAELTPIVQGWASEHPREMETMTALDEAGVSFGVFSSTVSALVGRVLDRPVRRPPDDIDLTIDPDHFAEAAGVLGAYVELDKPIQIETADGLTLRFRADEALVPGEDGVLPFQFLRPRTSLEDVSHSYDTKFSSTVADEGIAIFETDNGMVRLAHPAETLALQAILRRCGDGKNDAINAVLLSQFYTFEGDPYADQRAAEIGLDKRAWQFIQWAGERATRLSNGVPHVLERM